VAGHVVYSVFVDDELTAKAWLCSVLCDLFHTDLLMTQQGKQSRETVNNGCLRQVING
jgi:hypothetical protein